MNSVPMDRSNQAEFDVLLEQRIEQARITMTNAETADARREGYEEMRWLISQRSPDRIAEMELERGLRAP